MINIPTKAANDDALAILACHQLVKHFYDGAIHVDVLRGIDLRILAGERVAIVGRSGSGKTTLMHCLGGLDVANKGKVFVNGVDMAALSEKQRTKVRNQKLGFIYQFHHLLPEFSALENVAMPLLIGGVSCQQAKEQAMAMLERVGLQDRMIHKPSELSGGERQRAAIARALVTNPLCVLADEPTGNLDQRTANTIYEIIITLNQELKTSFIIATHDLRLVDQMHRTLTLTDGVLTAASTRTQ